MQQSSLLQPKSLGVGIAFEESTAAIRAKQKSWPKPSEATVGDVFYRFEDQLVSRGVDEWDNSLGSYRHLYCNEYEVSKVYPKGAYILGWFGGPNDIVSKGGRPVMDHYKNKFAYPTKGEALLGFIARKKRQQQILYTRYSGAREAEGIAERLLAKELLT